MEGEEERRRDRSETQGEARQRRRERERNQPVGERPRPDSSGVRARRRRRVTRDDRCVRGLSARYHAHAGSLGGASSNLVSDATGRIVSFSLWRCRIGATGRAADVPESQTLTRNVGDRSGEILAHPRTTWHKYHERGREPLHRSWLERSRGTATAG